MSNKWKRAGQFLRNTLFQLIQTEIQTTWLERLEHLSQTIKSL
jgi:hypothetical protein